MCRAAFCLPRTGKASSCGAPQAASHRGAAFKDFSAKDYVLPPDVQGSLGDRENNVSTAPDTMALKSDQAAVQLRLSFVGQIGPDEILLQLIEGEVGTEAELLKRKLTLTQREAEVVLWIARGKANRDIGEILGLSPRTVNKHLEQIFAKLGVENRTAAAAIAVRALSPWS
jgi:DNA-binding CsgD family transcriptional regulator